MSLERDMSTKTLSLSGYGGAKKYKSYGQLQRNTENEFKSKFSQHFSSFRLEHK